MLKGCVDFWGLFFFWRKKYVLMRREIRYTLYSIHTVHVLTVNILSNKCTLFYNFVVITTWKWNMGAETCSSLCMSHVLCHEMHLMDDILTEYTALWVTFTRNHVTGYKCLQGRKSGQHKEDCLQYILYRKCVRATDTKHAQFWALYVPDRTTDIRKHSDRQG